MLSACVSVYNLSIITTTPHFLHRNFSPFQARPGRLSNKPALVIKNIFLALGTTRKPLLMKRKPAPYGFAKKPNFFEFTVHVKTISDLHFFLFLVIPTLTLGVLQSGFSSFYIVPLSEILLILSEVTEP